MTSAARCQVPGADPWRRPPADGIEGLPLGMIDVGTAPPIATAGTMTSTARCQVPGADPWRRPPADGIEGLQVERSGRTAGRVLDGGHVATAATMTSTARCQVPAPIRERPGNRATSGPRRRSAPRRR
jgi:hypothetical protein